MISYSENGHVDTYPHADFDGPCTGPCCFPEAYPEPHFRCDECLTPLRRPGVCVECWNKINIA